MHRNDLIDKNRMIRMHSAGISVEEIVNAVGPVWSKDDINKVILQHNLDEKKSKKLFQPIKSTQYGNEDDYGNDSLGIKNYKAQNNKVKYVPEEWIKISETEKTITITIQSRMNF